MSRTLSIIILGGVVILVLGILGIVALLFSLGYFTIASGNITTMTPVRAIEETVTATSSPPTATIPAGATDISPTAVPTISTISGVIYQDLNQNGVYDSGETPVSNREVWLIPGTACHVRQDAVATTQSGGDGRYYLSGSFSGSYCVGLAGGDGLEDVASVAVAAGQSLDNINLQASNSGGSIGGWLWDDYCLTNEDGDALDGNCVADGNGDYHADGMISPDEGYIANVTMRLQAGPCATDNPAILAKTITDQAGYYVFTGLEGGTYCVLMNAAEDGNASVLLPGDWTFPAKGIWYQEITLKPGDQAYPVNFGWDYQLK